VGWECVGTALPHLFALDYIETWLRSHKRASDMQIRDMQIGNGVPTPNKKAFPQQQQEIIWCGNGNGVSHS